MLTYTSLTLHLTITLITYQYHEMVDLNRFIVNTDIVGIAWDQEAGIIISSLKNEKDMCLKYHTQEVKMQG